MRGRRVAMLLICGVCVLLGCSLFSSEPEKMTVDSDQEKVFNNVQTVISSRFSVKTASRKTGKIETQWKEFPSDVKTKRKRLFATVNESEESPGVIKITLRSEVQTVESGLKTYQPDKAEWDDAGRDRKLEQDLMGLIRIRLRREELEKEILNEMEKQAEREKQLEELKRKNQQSE